MAMAALTGTENEGKEPLLPICVFCGVECEPTSSNRLFLHPLGTPCPIQVVSHLGSSLDHLFEREGPEIFQREIDPTDILLQLFTPIEVACERVFDEFGYPRLGGTSGVEGWTSISTYQRCPYAWARSYIPGYRPAGALQHTVFLGDPFSREVGSLAHALLAIFYMQRIDRGYELSPDHLHAKIQEHGVNPAVVAEAWRVFTAYRIFYKFETIRPVAVEKLFVDDRTKRSCRADLLCIEESDQLAHPPGLYICDHKTTTRFDDVQLNGWPNEGAIIQQADIFASTWETRPEFKEWGPLQGVIINILGRQKMPEFHRAFVHPSSFQVDQHRLEAPYWQAQRNLSMAIGVFPRARNGCITRYGKCSEWDHCLSGEG